MVKAGPSGSGVVVATAQAPAGTPCQLRPARGMTCRLPEVISEVCLGNSRGQRVIMILQVLYVIDKVCMRMQMVDGGASILQNPSPHCAQVPESPTGRMREG